MSAPGTAEALAPALTAPIDAEGPRASQLVTLVLLFAPATIWGASFLFIAEGLSAVQPFGLTCFRLLAGAATLALLPASRRAIPISAWPAIALLGAIWFALPLTLYPFAEQRVSSALTGMLNGALPLLTAIAAAALERRAPGRRELTGLGVGLVGTLLVAAPMVREGQSSLLGLALILTALASLALALPVARAVQQRYGVLPVLWRAQLVALGLSLPLGLPELAAARWSPRPLLALLALGALGTGVAYALLAISAARFGATRASSVNFLIPGIALLLGTLVRGEEVAAISILGALVAAAGVRLLHH